MNEDQARADAQLRVYDDGELGDYEDLLLGYDWHNQAEHYAWVATADRAELLSWARAMRRNEREACGQLTLFGEVL